MKTKEKYSYEKVMEWLKTRVGLLDAVVFSGGEPLLQPKLSEAIIEAKEMGFKVGLHTAGIKPAHLNQIESLVDWIGLDFKHIPDQSRKITKRKGSAENGFHALEILSGRKKPFEVRTTVHSNWHNEEELSEMAAILSSFQVKNWVCQAYRQEGSLLKHKPENPARVYPNLKSICQEKGLKLQWR
jgi:pyruvate formate lyase activating enzyme